MKKTIAIDGKEYELGEVMTEEEFERRNTPTKESLEKRKKAFEEYKKRNPDDKNC